MPLGTGDLAQICLYLLGSVLADAQPGPDSADAGHLAGGQLGSEQLARRVAVSSPAGGSGTAVPPLVSQEISRSTLASAAGAQAAGYTSGTGSVSVPDAGTARDAVS
jgi:hypothetical protein